MEPTFNEQGLVPAIVQDARTGRVLMMAWMNAEAWRHTLETMDAHFWSRSRNALWRKGETSGNTMRVTGVLLDCDGDTVLLQVVPAGPACHTGERTCFYTPVAGEPVPSARGFLQVLDSVIRGRKDNPKEGSYTNRLFSEGTGKIAQKVGEESAETIVAALGQSDERLVAEAADLVYHTLVLLAQRGLRLADVEAELERRHR
jgi:phosphoribosyl-ATP pyrophosphohydrolase/phosphoribosyl-AMP cyclohydrolase